MKERPIIFSGPMIRAILDGRKTQTRRPIKSLHGLFVFNDNGQYQWDGKMWKACPYGQRGDKLWVRETWGLISPESIGIEDWIGFGHERPARIHPDSDDYDGVAAAIYRVDGEFDLVHGKDGQTYRSWRPAIHMPRWASRITLEITDVHIEKLQDISEEDAIAEGCGEVCLHPSPVLPYACENCMNTGYSYPPLLDFRETWDSIYAKRGLGWNANPWVWVITFQTQN